jgi:DinB superfamily
MAMPADAIDRYAAGPELLRYAAQGLTPEQEQARPGPGAWSIAELVTHMVDSDVVGIERMKRVIAEDEPTLMAYDQDKWINRLDAQNMPVAEAVALFAANRAWMTRILRKCSEADFARSGNHTEDGPKTLAKLLVGYVGHLDYHLKYLYAKRANVGVSLYPRYSTE